MKKITLLLVFCFSILYTVVGQDVAFRKIHNPTSGCALGKENVVVELYNNGSDDILSGFQLNYSINGSPAVTQIFQDRIPGYKTVTVTFDQAYDFTNNSFTNKDYTVCVWITKMDQDRQQVNDTMTITITSMGNTEPPTVPSVVNVPYRTSGTVTPALPASVEKGVMSWYAKGNNGVLDFIGYKATFNTPEITEDTTFYVSATPGTISEKTIGSGVVLTTDPFVFNAGYSRGRMLYTKEEIGNKGPITTIGFNVNNVANGKDGIPIKIYLKETINSKFESSSISWDNEVSMATLIVDERVYFDKTGWWYFELKEPYYYSGEYNLVIITETRCNDYCSSCNGCSYDVSGGSTYPRFKATTCEKGYVQTKSGNTVSLIDYGIGTDKTARLNTYFKFADVGCESEKVPVNIHVTDIPNYDVETKSLVYPQTNVCTLGDENIQVKVLNTKDQPIPADKVVVHAVINGTEISQTIADGFKANEEKIITFDTPFDFSAPTADKKFDYTIFTTINGEDNVYTKNDTVIKSLISKYTAMMPDSFVYQGDYTFPFIVLPEKDRSANIISYTYYATETASTALKSASNVKQYVTDSLYKSLTLWITGRTQTSSCVTRRVPVHIHVVVPQYDLKTLNLAYPTNYQCGVSQNANIKVSVCNADTTTSSVIPAGTFKVSAKITDNNTITGSSVINMPLTSMKASEISIALNNLGSATQNKNYQYTIYSDPTDPKMYVFRNNDTIKGNLYIPANPATPEALEFSAPYGQPYQVKVPSKILNDFYFYENSSDKVPFAQGQGFLTEPVYGTQTYYYSGRIKDEKFDEFIDVGSSKLGYGYPFNFSANRSFTKTYYTKAEVGGNPGVIDTIYMYVQTKNESEASIPIKIWMKNCDNLSSAIENKFNKTNTWEVETSEAQLIFDGEMAFDEEGWLAIPIYGGFSYDGKGGIYFYTEHNCDCKDCSGTGCLAKRGVNPLPKFYNTSISQKVITKTNAESVTFSSLSYRLNLKFQISHTCTSSMNTITVNTTVPSNDVEVLSVVSPTAQSSNYTAMETVRAVIKNRGKSEISNFPISYQLDNNAPVKQNYTKRLAAGKTDTVTFTQALDLTGIYFETPLKVFSELSNDAYRGNDTATVMLSKDPTCVSYPMNATGLDIAHVKFAGIDNVSGDGSFDQFTDLEHNGKYTDYSKTVAPGTVFAGQTFPIEITHAFANKVLSSVSKYVYIDYNRDGSFDEKTELVFSVQNLSSLKDKAITTGFVNVPFDASVGLTRMRVLCVGDSKWSSPCGVYDNGNMNVYGETEDYVIKIESPATTDLGVIRYVHPVGNVCPDEQATAKIVIRNIGTQVQNFSASNPVTLTMKVSGAKNNTYTKVVDEGSLNSGDTMLVMFDDVNIGTKGAYTFMTTLSYANDSYAGNDTASCHANTNKILIYQSLSAATQNFDANNDGTESWLPNGWSLNGSNNDYRWKNTKGHSPQYPSGGPEHDHTFANTSLQENGSYMSVSNSGSKYFDDWTALTSGCINMHSQNGFPVEISFYKYLYGTNSATYTMTVEVGSGSDFMVLDSITEKTDGCSTAEWVQHIVSCADFDAVGQIRFKMTGQKNAMDPSIDDIAIVAGLPDLGVQRIEYPYDFRDSLEHPDACLNAGDTVYPTIIIKNNSSLVARDYRLMCVMTSGSIRDTVIEDATDVIASQDSLTYTFKQGIVIPERNNRCQFFIIADIDYDSEDFNNIKNVIICTTTGIDDHEQNDVLVLGQNIPNPAVNMTKIPYRIPEPGQAALKIYSSVGQLLYTETQDAFAGENIFEVPTVNFKSGIYFYTLMYEGTSLTKKMIIQK